MTKDFLIKVHNRPVNHTQLPHPHPCPALSVGYSGSDMLDSDVTSLLCAWAFLKTHGSVSYCRANSSQEECRDLKVKSTQ